MQTLDDYLTGSYLTDTRDISSVEKVIREVSGTLTSSFDKTKGWPYAIHRQKPIKLNGLSHSTTCMVSLSLWKLLHQWKQPKKSSPNFPQVEIEDAKTIYDVASSATALLFAEITRNGQVATRSGSYGTNDPITLSFLADICQVESIQHDERTVKIRQYIESSVKKHTSDSSGALADHASFYQASKNEPVENAIIPLRVAQACTAVITTDGDDLRNFREYFEKNLHEHLSFSSIPDSRFDPAELAFCLEGLLLVQREAVDRTLFQRVVDVLARAQEESAFWRPVKPFMADETGFSLFPVSVEVANSLLRSCELYDGDALHDTFGSASIPLFRRYWQWLRARTVQFQHGGIEYVGWHSEHINETDSIHVWETSQVLEFLLNYRRALQAHIARTTLLLARFSIREPKKKKWEKLQNVFEPVIALGHRYAVYDEIGKDFVGGWGRDRPERFSMLLYGPPGTGKTTVAESISDALGFRMVTITVSDFLAGGGAQLEARAKAIFDVLLAQSKIVVLFDEIDNFLLDRDSRRYGQQDSAFQFMTPGMLTKLNELRRSERVLFVIATNYENRIDSAIKRTGRVDKRYLVLPPDAEGRKRILSDLIARKLNGTVIGKIEDSDWRRLAKASLFLGYKDMEAAVIECSRVTDKVIDALEAILSVRARTTSLGSYASKFATGPEAMDNSQPLEEFIALVGLALEVDEDLSSAATQRAVETARKVLTDGGGLASFPGLADSPLGGKIAQTLTSN
ncbi:ATP-binding protein [Sinorhizobium meliloti]|uniref:ATP-binding protein n=1 Tax=Rhizobium meliloti TaxID=382 RepID=UPI00192DE9E6|nr:ATP-binding protein [Sinorhizobium meliloti]